MGSSDSVQITTLGRTDTEQCELVVSPVSGYRLRAPEHAEHNPDAPADLAVGETPH